MACRFPPRADLSQLALLLGMGEVLPCREL